MRGSVTDGLSPSQVSRYAGVNLRKDLPVQDRGTAASILVRLLVLLMASSPHTHVWADDRVFSIDINETERGGYELAFKKGRALGTQAATLPIKWDEVERQPGVFDPQPNWLAIANQFYPNVRMKLALGVHPIDTNQLRVPDDLKGRPFDDPLVIRRYLACLEWVLKQIPDCDLISIAVGNEIDAYLGHDRARWEAYTRFLNAAVEFLKARKPRVPVGTKIMFTGYGDVRLRSWVRAVNAKTDVWMVTYYPLNADFTVRDPKEVKTDVTWLLDAFQDKPFYFMETGYPSGAGCRSSEFKQAEFVHELFRTWDHHAKRIPYLNMTWLSDIPPTTTYQYTQYYGLDTSGFRGFLDSLGLRSWRGEGRDKLGYKALLEETRKRGWLQP